MKKKKIRILVVFISLFLVVFSFGITFSMFHSDTNLLFDDQEIASFVFDAKKTNHLDFNLTDIKPGDELEYTFLVQNNVSKKVSHVSIAYLMSIETYHFMPLEIKLYKIVGSNEKLIMTCDESYSRNSNNSLVCNSGIQEMEYNKEITDNYKIKVRFPSEYNDISYADLVDYISVDISSYQKTS